MSQAMMYHATYRPYLASIQAWGLGGAPEEVPRNYEDSQAGLVYLATTRDVAVSYAETSDVVPVAWLDDIVVLSIDVGQLNTADLHPDRNVRLDDTQEPQTYEYHGVIPASALSLAL